MADVILKNIDGSPATYKNVNQVVLTSTTGEAVVYSEGGGGGMGVQADYAQNIETEMDYIKNRPFYDEVKPVVIMEETDCPFINDSTGLKLWSNTSDFQNFDPVFDLVANEIYEVVFDGVTYTCKAASKVLNGLSGVGIGNFGLIGETNTGEPFVFGTFNSTDQVACYTMSGDSHTISITHIKNELKQIDEKYIPDTIARVSDISELSPQVQVDWNENNELSPAYIKNKPIITAGGGAVIQPNYDQNDSTQSDYIKNRPFFDNLQSYKGDFSTTPSVSFDLMNFTWWKATDLHPTVDELSNYRVVYENTSSGYKFSKVTEQSEILLATDDFVTVQMDLPRVDNPERTINVGYCSVHTVGEVSFSYMGYPLTVNFQETGTYYAMPQGTEPDTDGSFGFETGGIKSIDLKYVSEWLPAYDSRKILANFDGDITDKEFVPLDANGYTFLVKVSNDGIDKSVFDNEKVYVKISTDGESESTEASLDASNLMDIDTDVYALMLDGSIPGILVINSESFSMDGLTGTKGVYFLRMAVTENVFTYVSSFGYGELKQLDPKFLPADIGSSALPEVTTSDNNKVLGVVNGEWAATEASNGLPDVTSSDNGKVLKVSGGTWTLGKELPDATADDNGKFLRIVNGSPAWILVPNAEEVAL